MIKRVIQNSSYLILAQLFVKGISFFYTLFLARELGVENFGLYTLALSYFALISAVSDFGISNYLIRQISSGQKSIGVILSNILVTRFLIGTFVLGLVSLGVLVLDPLGARATLILIAMVTLIPQMLAITVDSIFVAMQKFSYSALGLAVLNISTAVFGVILIKSGFGPFGAVFAFIIGQLLYASFLSILLYNKEKIPFLSTINVWTMGEIIKGSLPYGFLGVLGLLYFKVDTILLSYLKGAYDTGIYAAAYKFLEAVIFIPSALSITLFPALAKLSTNDPDKVYKLYKNSLIILLGISLVVMSGFVFILPQVIGIFLTKYLSSIKVLRILALTIPFFFMVSAQSALLLSQKKFLKKLIYASIFNFCLNLVLNLIFIPRYSYIASAWITLLSDFISFSIFFIIIKLSFTKANEPDLRKSF